MKAINFHNNHLFVEFIHQFNLYNNNTCMFWRAATTSAYHYSVGLEYNGNQYLTGYISKSRLEQKIGKIFQKWQHVLKRNLLGF